LFLRATAVDGSVDETERTIKFVASTEDIDGHGTIVRQNWRLERFKPSGPVLYAHDLDDIPVGTATVALENGALTATVKFSTADLNPDAELVWKNVKAGVLRGISPGFIPHTVTCETHDDRMVMVLDDNELFELSITACPSNAAALAQMRSLIEPAASPAPAASQQSPPPADGPAANDPQPITKETTTMADKNDPTNTISVARALGLPAGATEQDAISAAVKFRELDVQLMTITGAKTTDEALGALRGMAGAAESLKKANAELATVKAERDTQNFEALVQRGIAEAKLTPAEEKYERELFAKAMDDGRGAARVAELTGYLNVKAPDPRRSRDLKPPSPTTRTTDSTPLVWNGKPYGELSYSQRAVLAKENPELFRLMKTEHAERAA
jgi:HK97 family phage prohead protease